MYRSAGSYQPQVAGAGRLVDEFGGEARATEAQQPGACRAVATLSRQQATDLPQALQVRQAHGLVPLDLADGQEGLPVAAFESEGRDVNLAGFLLPGSFTVAWVDTPGETTGDLLGERSTGQ